MSNPTKSEVIAAYQSIADSVTDSTISLTDDEVNSILNQITDYNIDNTVFPNVKPVPSIKFR